jgi:hypothetical protein
LKPKTLFLALGVLTLILACNMPFSQPEAPVQAATVVWTATMPQPDLASTLPTGGGNPISAPTNTPLPPLPEFEQVITFLAGGGGGECDYPKSPNMINVPSARYGRYAQFCMTILGMEFDEPFYLQLTAPNGKTYTSPAIWLDQETKDLLWDGYPQSFSGYASWSGNGILYAGILIWWPSSLSEGQWQVQAYSDRFRATGVFSIAQQAGKSYINAIDSRYENQIMPGNNFSGRHPLMPKGNGGVDVFGRGFPADKTVYVLLYHFIPVKGTSGKAEWLQTAAILADHSGQIQMELAGPVKDGESYLVIGLTDPSTPLNGDFLNSNSRFPSDYFMVGGKLAVPPTLQSSCPGAPPQRMTLNQRGYVCTRSDAVRVRVSPARSANTLVQIYPGTPFTVIGGPSCSDDWSWWNVRLDNGTTGWVSEGGDEVDQYFICPN